MSRTSTNLLFARTLKFGENFSNVKNIGLVILFFIFSLPFNLVMLAEILDQGKAKITTNTKPVITELALNKELEKSQTYPNMEHEILSRISKIK